MKEEYKAELKKVLQQAVDTLPFIPTPYLKKGVVGKEKIRIGIMNEATYTLHERVVGKDDAETQTLTIVQEKVGGDPATKGAIIVDKAVQRVSGFDELACSDGSFSEEVMLFAALGLLSNYLDCSRFEIPSKRPSVEVRKI
jgi:hypothetical protein